MDADEKTDILVFAEQKNGIVHRVTYELLGKSKELAKDLLNCKISCVVLGNNSIDTQVLIQHGVDIVYHIVDEAAFDYPDEMVYAKNIVQLARDIQPEIFLLGATAYGRSLAPRIAAALKTGLTADCTQLSIIDGDFVQIRPAFSENILAHIVSCELPQMATVRYQEFEESERMDRKGKAIKLDPIGGIQGGISIISKHQRNEIDITNANIIVSAGMGIKSPEAIQSINELSDLLGAMVGASRPLVESGFLSKDHQIGYSGNRVKPSLYIACGISGAAQHIAGMKGSKMIVAINKDPNAPITKVADYSLIGNAEEILPIFIQSIKKMKR